MEQRADGTSMAGDAKTSGLALHTVGLSIGYEDRSIVSDITMDVVQGEMLAIVGTNGAGKSTFVKTLAGLLRPVSGVVQVLDAMPGRRPAQVAYMGQHHAVNEALPIRVRDVVGMGRFAHLGLWRRPRALDRALVEDSMERTGICDIAQCALYELSGGQRQRVHLAQALAHQADVYLLDEATAGIDAAGRESCLQILEEERARHATVITATHDFGEAARADKVILLANRVVATGPPAQVLTKEHLVETFGITVAELGDHVFAYDPHHHR